MDDSTPRVAADPAERGPHFVPPEELVAAPSDLGAAPEEPAYTEAAAEAAEPPQRGLRRIGLPLALVAAGLVGGAAIGGVASAAASSTSDSVADRPSISSGSLPGDGSQSGDAAALPDGLGSPPDGGRHGGRGPGSESADQQARSGSTSGSQLGSNLAPPSHTGTGASG